MKFYPMIQDGELTYAPPIAEQRKKLLEKQKDGTVFEETLTVFRPSKTRKQLGAFWGLAMSIAVAELDDRGYDTSFLLNVPKPTGIAITKDLLCEYLYNVCPIFDEDGKRITLSKANTQQAAKFFDDCRNFMASQWSITIPEPSPLWREEKAKVT